MDKPTKKRKFDDALSTEVEDQQPLAKRRNRTAAAPDYPAPTLKVTAPRTYSYDTTTAVEILGIPPAAADADGYGYGYGYGYGSEQLLKGSEGLLRCIFIQYYFPNVCYCRSNTFTRGIDPIE